MELRSKKYVQSASSSETKNIDATVNKINLSEFKFQKKNKISNTIKPESSEQASISDTNQASISDTNQAVNKIQAKSRKLTNQNEKHFETSLPVKVKKELNEDKINESTIPITMERQHIKVEYDDCELSQKNNELKNQRKKIKKTDDYMPHNWEIVLNNLRDMRKNFNAPVDSMGCHKCHDQAASPKVSS